MKKRQQRIIIIILAILVIVAATGLTLTAFQKNLLFFFTPSQVVAGEAPENYDFRVGGMVMAGSVDHDENSLLKRFVLTDNKQQIKVEYHGILPSLFREGQGIIAKGRLQNDTFIADNVLAKHDETYMPPEVADMLANQKEKSEP